MGLGIGLEYLAVLQEARLPITQTLKAGNIHGRCFPGFQDAWRGAHKSPKENVPRLDSLWILACPSTAKKRSRTGLYTI